jgi:hypothetical protein
MAVNPLFLNHGCEGVEKNTNHHHAGNKLQRFVTGRGRYLLQRPRTDKIEMKPYERKLEKAWEQGMPLADKK